MFRPALPLGGYAGWKAFQRSEALQFNTFRNQQSIIRDSAYFRDNIGKVESAKDLIADRKLLTVALGAYGLEDEIGKRAIIRRVMEEGVLDPKAFANRLNDPRWKAFAAAFDFSTGLAPPAMLPSVQDDIVAKFQARSFEHSVGDVDTDFRLAMNFRREALAIASGANVDRVGWLQIMGQKPLRSVVEAAFNLPSSLANLDIDRQREILESKSLQVFGLKSPKVFLDKQNVETALRRFFAKSQLEAGPTPSARGFAALSMLSSTGLSSTASLSLSNFKAL